MRALRFAIFYIAAIAIAVFYGKKWYPSVDQTSIIYIAIGFAILVGITELIEIFDNIHKTMTDDKPKEQKGS